MLPNLSGLGLGAPTGPMLQVLDPEKVTCMITQEDVDLGAYAWYLNVYVSGDSGPTEQLPHPYNVLALAEWLKNNRKAPDTNQIVTEEDRVNCLNTARALEEYSPAAMAAARAAMALAARAGAAPAPAPAVQRPSSRYHPDTIDTVRPLPAPAREVPRVVERQTADPPWDPAPAAAPGPALQVQWPLPLSHDPPAPPGRGRGDGDSPTPQRGQQSENSSTHERVMEAIASMRTDLEVLQERCTAMAQRVAATTAAYDNIASIAQAFYRIYGMESGFVDQHESVAAERNAIRYRTMRYKEARDHAQGRLDVLVKQRELAQATLEWYTTRIGSLGFDAEGNLQAYAENYSNGERVIEDPGWDLDDLREEAREALGRDRRRRQEAIRSISSLLAAHPRDHGLQALANSSREDYGDPEFDARGGGPARR